jgi:hypothetical protein
MLSSLASGGYGLSRRDLFAWWNQGWGRAQTSWLIARYEKIRDIPKTTQLPIQGLRVVKGRMVDACRWREAGARSRLPQGPQRQDMGEAHTIGYGYSICSHGRPTTVYFAANLCRFRLVSGKGINQSRSINSYI